MGSEHCFGRWGMFEITLPSRSRKKSPCEKQGWFLPLLLCNETYLNSRDMQWGEAASHLWDANENTLSLPCGITHAAASKQPQNALHLKCLPSHSLPHRSNRPTQSIPIRNDWLTDLCAWPWVAMGSPILWCSDTAKLHFPCCILVSLGDIWSPWICTSVDHPAMSLEPVMG